MIDLHNHTQFGDGKDSPAEMAKAAMDKGISVFGFSEHFPRPEGYDYPAPSFNHEGLASNWFDYVSLVMQEKNKGESQKILFGTEIDYLPDEEGRLEAEISAFDFDYIIGSVHMIGKWGFDYDHKDWRGKDVDALYETYYDTLSKMIKWGNFDIVGHLDIIKVFNRFHPPKRDHKGRAMEILKEIARTGKTIEINTGSLRKECRELSPSPELIKEAVGLNIPITLGSDAHRAQDVGYHLDEVLDNLRDMGVGEIVYFEKREPVPVGI